MWWLILLLLIVVVAWVIGAFNGLVVLRNRVDEAASDIDVQLKRRHDLIPNLINTVQGYAQHERELLERVTQARTAAMGAMDQGMAAKAQAESALSSTLKSLFAVAENYPELKANQNFLALQEELSDTENKIMSSRRFYNTNVRDYNTRREVFPTNFIATQFKFTKRDLFELEDDHERQVPQVDFNKPKPQVQPSVPPQPHPSQAPAEAPHPPAPETTEPRPMDSHNEDVDDTSAPAA